MYESGSTFVVVIMQLQTRDPNGDFSGYLMRFSEGTAGIPGSRLAG